MENNFPLPLMATPLKLKYLQEEWQRENPFISGRKLWAFFLQPPRAAAAGTIGLPVHIHV